MKKVLRIIAPFLLLFTLLWGDDRRSDKSVLVVMTLNAEFLWDGVDPEEGAADFPWKGSQTEAEEHMQKVAQLIIQGNPDIVNLVEVENIQSLTTFNDKFLAGRGYRPFLINGTDTATGQDVALLSRIDPDTMTRDNRQGQKNGVKKTVSKNYLATFQIGTMKVAFVGLHFLAFPLRADRVAQRQAQAEVIRLAAIEKKIAGFSVVVLGDFNDYDGDPASKDHIDSQPSSTVLAQIRGMDPATSADDLTNAASFLPKARRFTAHHDANGNGMVDPPNEFTSIDHILLSPELASKVEAADILQAHHPLEVTDHFPVLVTIRLSAPVPPAGGAVRMASLLPNPPGNESQNERATLKNIGSTPVSLVGWKLRDRAGQTWSLNSLGSLAAGQEKTIQRLGQPMALNNNGDTVDLLDPTGAVVQSVTYGPVDENEEVTP